MQIVFEEFCAKYEVKKSTFIAHLIPYQSLDATKKRLKIEHPKSRHIAWAYRTLNEFNQVQEHASDDGEPKGTAGVPMLNTMRGANLINSALLVVRYFGGIKLGTGGLVRAYGASANSVIQSSNLMLFEPKKEITFEVPYPLMRQFEHFFNTHNITEIKKEFQASFVEWKAYLSALEEKEFLIFYHSFDFSRK